MKIIEKRIFSRLIWLASIIFMLTLWHSPVLAKTITIKLGNIDAVAEITLNKSNGEFNSQDLIAQAFKKHLELISPGRFDVKIFPAGQMGGNREIWEMTKQGSLEMNTCDSTVLAMFVPEAEALQVPYIFRDWIVALRVLDGPVGREFNELILKKIGVRVFAWNIQSGLNFMTTGRAVRLPGDLKGLKIRVPESQSLIKLTSLTGAVATPIPFSEVYTSLQQGVVDGVNTGIVYVQATGINELIKHINVADPWIGFGGIQINEKFYRSLSPEDQILVKEAALHANTQFRGMAMYGRTLWAEHFKKIGINVVVPLAAEKQEWVKAIKQPMLEWTKEKIGSEWIDKFIQASEQAEKELYGD